MKNKRRNHSAQVKVALAAAKGQKNNNPLRIIAHNPRIPNAGVTGVNRISLLKYNGSLICGLCNT